MNKKPIIKFVRPNRNLPSPRRVHSADAGSDLICAETVYIQPLETQAVSTNTRIDIPSGYFGRVCGRSGLSAGGLLVHPGTIDSGYTGVIKVIMTNLSSQAMCLEESSRIAQIIILPIYEFDFEEVNELEDRPRGNKGFGHSGR